ncbi:MAG TPA: thioredoxin [Coriobacteriaceae bacterium]|nr:thioredoxin [Coriobacteriaceae bacterium]
MVQHATSADFDEVVLGAQEPVLVDFFATWCGPCNMLAPVIEEVADEMQGKAHVFKVDIDESRDIAERYHISSVPTLMLFKNGEPVKKNVGAMPKYGVLAMFD